MTTQPTDDFDPTRPAALQQETATAVASRESEDDIESPTKPKRRLWLRVLLVGLCLLLFTLLVAGMFLNAAANARYDADLMTLVPDDVVLTVELRRLDDPRRGRQGSTERFERFLSVLKRDPAFQRYLESPAGREVLGDPPIWEAVDEIVRNVDAAPLPLEFLLGKHSVKEDILAGEAVVGFRARSGAQAHGSELFDDSLASITQRSDAFVLVRTTNRTKAYYALTNFFGLWTQFDSELQRQEVTLTRDASRGIVSIAFERPRTESLFATIASHLDEEAIPSNLRRHLRVRTSENRLELFPIAQTAPPIVASDFAGLAAAFADPTEGEAVAADLQARMRGLTETIHFTLFDDVIAIATCDELMRDMHTLAQQRGRSGNSLWESGRLKAAYESAVEDAGTEAVEKSLVRLYTDGDQLDRILPFRRALDLTANLEVIEATERMLDTIRAAAIDPESMRAGLFLLDVTNDAFAGPMIVSDGYVVHDNESVNELTIASLQQPRKPSRIPNLMPREAYIVAGLNRNLNELRQQVEDAVVGETSDLLEYVRMLLGTDHFGNELGLMFAEHPLDDYRPGDGNFPGLLIVLELHERHGDAVATDPITLARDVFGEMIPTEDDQVGYFATVTYRGHTIIYPYMPKDRNLPVSTENNAGPRMFIETLGSSFVELLGPAADPAYAVVDGFVVIATSLHLLNRMIDAAVDNGSRLKNSTDLGAAASRRVKRGAVLEIMSDIAGRRRAGYVTPYETRLLTFQRWHSFMAPIAASFLPTVTAVQQPFHGRPLVRVPEDIHDYPAQRQQMLEMIERGVRVETHDRAAYLAAQRDAEQFGIAEAKVRAGHLAERFLDALDAGFAQQNLPYFLLPSFREVEEAMFRAIRENPGNPLEQERAFAERFRGLLREMVEGGAVQRMSLGVSRQSEIWQRALQETGGDERRAEQLYEQYEREELAREKGRWRAFLRHEQHERNHWVAQAQTWLVPWWSLQLTAPQTDTEGVTTSHVRILICLGDGQHR